MRPSSCEIRTGLANVHTRLASGQDIIVAITNGAVTDSNLQPGQSVQLLIKSTEVAVAIEPVEVVSLRSLGVGEDRDGFAYRIEFFSGVEDAGSPLWVISMWS